MGIFSELGGVATGGLSVLYKYMAELAVVFALVVGAFFYGHHEGALSGKEKMAQLEAQMAEQSSKLDEIQTFTNTKIITKYVTRTVKIQDQNQKNDQIAKDDKDDANVILSKYWVCVYNASLIGEDATPCTKP